MRRKLLIIAGAIIVIGAAAAAALYHAYPVQMATYAGLTRNYFFDRTQSLSMNRCWKC
jgi:hypothetical protein